jgi:hypothetical protein
LRDIFTFSQLKTSKKPRGYRIFLKIRFDFTFVVVLQIDFNNSRAIAVGRKKFKESLQLSAIFRIFPQKTF